MAANVNFTIGNWHRRTEYIVAVCEIIFAMLIFILYYTSKQTVAGNIDNWLTESAIIIFPIICFFRLAYVIFLNPGSLFGWISAGVDVLFLTVIIYIFSLQYGNFAASFNAPAFAFYFVFMALHGLRFDPWLTFAIGVLCVVLWAVMILIFTQNGVEITHDYQEFISSSTLLIGVEVEKMFALAACATLLAFGASRARVLLEYEYRHQAEIADIVLQETQKSLQSKSDFMATMSHELRTPMNGVLGMAQVLQNTNLDERQQNMVDIIHKSGGTMMKMVDDILNYSALEEGTLSVNISTFNLRELLAEIISDMNTRARGRNIDLILQIKPALPSLFKGDAHKISQILVNILDNALKFTHVGAIHIYVEGNNRENATDLLFVIEDTGIGIAPSKVDTIFDPLTQIDSSLTREYGGTGLGLAISKKLVEEMNGSIGVVSKVDEGSVFSFEITLPNG